MSIKSHQPPTYQIDPALALPDSVLTEAVRQFGTPLYVYDAALLATCWQRLRSVLPVASTLYYSVKANPNLHLIREFYTLGANFEVASGGELVAVLAAGVPGKQIIFVGPGKSQDELADAIRAGLHVIVAESHHELMRLNDLAASAARTVRTSIRVNPGRGGGQITMGGITQFGVEPATARALFATATAWPHLDLVGIHAYLGTGILDAEQIVANTALIYDVARTLQADSGLTFDFVDVGGGFGIPYYERDQRLDWQALASPLRRLTDTLLADADRLRHVGFESGRFLVGPCGVFLTRVVDVKQNGGKTFAILDGGVNVFSGNERYMGARPLPMRVLQAGGNTPTAPVTLCGPLCTSTDRLAADVALPPLQIGAVIAIYQAGAYGPTASPGLFLSHGFPAEAIYKNGRLHLIRRRTRHADILASQQVEDERIMPTVRATSNRIQGTQV